MNVLGKYSLLYACFCKQANKKRIAWANVNINGYLLWFSDLSLFGNQKKNASKLDPFFLWHEQSMEDGWTFSLWISLLSKASVLTWMGSCKVLDRKFVTFINLYFFCFICWTNIYWMHPMVKHSPSHQRGLLLCLLLQVLLGCY